jgi:hypothetical protein
MRAHTYREYLAWLDWLEDQWNVPNRSDNYLIQIAAEIRNVVNSFSKNSLPVKLKDFILNFKRPKPVKRLSKEEKSKQAKSRWTGMLGRTIGKDG